MLAATTVLITAVATLGTSCGYAAPVGSTAAEVQRKQPCKDLNRAILDQVATGSPDVDRAIAALAGPGCAGPVLADLASTMLKAGRFPDAEKYARRSIDIMVRTRGSSDRALLRPLHFLAVAGVEQQKVGAARKAFERMRNIPADEPVDRFLLHATAALLLLKEGRHAEAEQEYLEALSTLDRAGLGSSGDAASLLMALGSLSIHDGRINEASRRLDSALAIYNTAPNAVSAERISVLYLRAVVDLRQGKLPDAREKLQAAVSMLDRIKDLDPEVQSCLLARYARVLRKQHRGRQARAIEVRAAALHGYRPSQALVDVSELAPDTKR
jgi:tetratricopeptide (TPR) repeat protein